MKKVSVTIVSMLLVVFSALAYGKSKPLADQQMDRISAGTAFANTGSVATDTHTASVDLSGSALSGASGINIVNASDSTVANGANTWSADSLHDAVVSQANLILQDVDADASNAIALGGSVATDKVTDSVTLAGSAESNAKALNIVNAAGSLVANGVNVASSTGMNNLSLIQLNAISQTTH